MMKRLFAFLRRRKPMSWPCREDSIKKFFRLHKYTENILRMKSTMELENLLEAMPYAPSLYLLENEVYMFVLAEIIFVDLKNKNDNFPQIERRLHTLREYGIRTEDSIKDKYSLVVYHFLRHMYYLRKDSDIKAAREALLEYERVTAPFEKPEDRDYIACVKEYMKTENYDMIDEIFNQRMRELFLMRFDEIGGALLRSRQIAKDIKKEMEISRQEKQREEE